MDFGLDLHPAHVTFSVVNSTLNIATRLLCNTTKSLNVENLHQRFKPTLRSAGSDLPHSVHPRAPSRRPVAAMSSTSIGIAKEMPVPDEATCRPPFGPPIGLTTLGRSNPTLSGGLFVSGVVS